MDVLEFYDDNVKNVYRGVSATDNLYIRFYRYDVSEYCDVSEHVGV